LKSLPAKVENSLYQVQPGIENEFYPEQLTDKANQTIQFIFQKIPFEILKV
jgi:hypothetical protein